MLGARLKLHITQMLDLKSILDKVIDFHFKNLQFFKSDMQKLVFIGKINILKSTATILNNKK